MDFISIGDGTGSGRVGTKLRLEILSIYLVKPKVGGTRSFGNLVSENHALESHPRLLRHTFGSRTVRRAERSYEGQSKPLKTVFQDRPQRFRRQSLCAILRSDIIIYISHRAIGLQMTETTAADHAPCFPQNHRPRSNSPLQIFAKAKAEKIVRFDIGIEHSKVATPQRYKVKVRRLKFTQYQSLGLKHWHRRSSGRSLCDKVGHRYRNRIAHPESSSCFLRRCVLIS